MSAFETKEGLDHVEKGEQYQDDNLDLKGQNQAEERVELTAEDVSTLLITCFHLFTFSDSNLTTRTLEFEERPTSAFWCSLFGSTSSRF